MQTVIETPACIAAAKDAGMTADEMTAVVDTIAQNVEAGEIVPGCGGARKLCVAKPGKGKSGKGKSGGYRVITYYAGDVFPVLLPTVFGKNEKASLPQSERNALAGLTKRLTDTRKRLGSAFHRGAWCTRRRARKKNDVTKAFDKIAAGLEDAIAYAGGDTTRGRIANAVDVKQVRAATGMTQADFAGAYRLPIGTVRDWEQNRRQPDAPARVLLSMIGADPKGVERIIHKATP